MLFIMGMRKYGKSTLINALLRQKVAEMDFLPKTWKIDVLKVMKSRIWHESSVKTELCGNLALRNARPC